MAGTIASYTYTFYFTENSIKVIENHKKEVTLSPWPTPKSEKRLKAVYFERGGHYDGKYPRVKLGHTVNMLHSINLKVHKLVGVQTSCSSLRSVTSFPTLFTTCKN